MLTFATACLLPAFLLSFLVTAAMRRIAPRWGLIDQPAARKVHVTPTPLGGGIGIWFGVVIPLSAGAFVALQIDWEQPPAWMPSVVAQQAAEVLGSLDVRAGLELLFAVLGCGTLLALMGLIDDRWGLPWFPRLLVQLAVAIGLVAAGIQATVFVPLPWVGWIITVAWILVLVNSFNFLDNMDGLSGGIALVAAVLFAIVMLSEIGQPRWLVGGAMLVLAGSLAGFLCHNWPPARIFMGDSGSYFVGLLMATLTIRGTFYDPGMGERRHVMLAPLCILAVPLYDFCSVMVIRLRQRRSPFHPDKSHFSHRLVELGLKPRNAVLTIHLATLTTGLGALLLYRIRGWSGALLIVSLIACVLAMIAILETAGRRKQNSHRRE